MSLKRTTIIFVGGVAIAAWLSAAMSPGRPPAVANAIRPAPIDATGAELAGEISRLRERLRPDVSPRDAIRNPFVFRSAPRASSVAALAAVDELPAPAVASQSLQPRLTLSGIAEDPDPGGVLVRTAIITGNGQLFLAKEGDAVNDRDVEYKVGKISADSAELVDPRDGSTRRLTLK